MTDDNEEFEGFGHLSPQERFARSPRPLDYIRVRLNANGQADYILSILEDEKEDLFTDLADARIDGKTESDPEIQEIRANLNHLIRAIRDIESGKIELVGGKS